jgi:hypothetical protein
VTEQRTAALKTWVIVGTLVAFFLGWTIGAVVDVITEDPIGSEWSLIIVGTSVPAPLIARWLGTRRGHHGVSVLGAYGLAAGVWSILVVMGACTVFLMG